ncbi:FadR/GntR family transcriptional regulator [Nakamurella alba]|uniref:FadR/GntR family transcriptional regulator n=1 Tax=Nakamurella alba TaxID=2665158 RepID=UPI0012B8799C|nr:FadR/GntR family transcriptional regulator [Nakamurella alba]
MNENNDAVNGGTSTDERPSRKLVQTVPKAATLVAQSIVNEISEYGYAPGHRLASELQMMKEYGVARGTLREALRILEHHGVIRVRSGPGGGPMVQNPGAGHLASTLALLMQVKKVPVSAVLELRTLTEPLLSALAADRITADQLARLDENLSTMQDSLDDDRAFVSANMRFHQLVAEASGNVLLASIVESLDHILDRKLAITYSPRVRRAIHQSHAEILAKLRDGDPQEARAAMWQHLRDSERFFARGTHRLLNDTIEWRASD